jgi:biotin carboxyl carrier protein
MRRPRPSTECGGRLRYQVQIDGVDYDLEIDRSPQGTTVKLGDRSAPADLVRIGGSAVYSLILEDSSHEISVHKRNGDLEIVVGGQAYLARVRDERAMKIAAAGGGATDGATGAIVRAPMPGVVVGIGVGVGDEVSPGQGVVTLEAMKMENELKSASGGTVREIRVEVGQGVSQGEALVVIE